VDGEVPMAPVVPAVGGEDTVGAPEPPLPVIETERSTALGPDALGPEEDMPPPVAGEGSLTPPPIAGGGPLTPLSVAGRTPLIQLPVDARGQLPPSGWAICPLTQAPSVIKGRRRTVDSFRIGQW